MSINMPNMLPYLTVQNAEETAKFYSKVFGFELLPQDGGDNSQGFEHAEMHFRDMVIMFCSEGAFGSTSKSPKSGNFESPITLYFYVEDVDVFYKQVKSHGVEIELELQDQFWGDRMFSLIEINGYRFSFATKLLAR